MSFHLFGKCEYCGRDTDTAGKCYGIDCPRYQNNFYTHGRYQYWCVAPQNEVHECPVCSGTGKVSRPPWVPGDINEWTDNSTGPYECQACEGKGYIVIPIQTYYGVI